MYDAHPEHLAFQLRAISQRLHLEPLRHVVRQAGYQTAWRLSVLYHDHRALDSVATLITRHQQSPQLAIHYQQLFNERPICHTIPAQRYEQLVNRLQSLRFDHLRDQPGLPDYPREDLWLLERAAGTFYHSLIIAPQSATDAHAQIVECLRQHLPEALRLIPVE